MKDRVHGKKHEIAALGLVLGLAAMIRAASGAPARPAEAQPGGAPEAHAHAHVEAPALAGFRVADRATDVDPERLGVEILAPDTRSAAETAAALAAAVRLVNEAGEEIPIDAHTRVSPRGEDGRVPAAVDVKAGDLPTGWYALELADIPRGVRFHGDRGPLAPDRAAAVRFRIGSAPLLRGVLACAKPDGLWALRLDPSEPVLAPGLGVGDVVSVAVPGGARCEPAAQRAGADERLSHPRRSLDLLCDPPPDGAAASVTIHPGLRSARGAPLAPGSIRRELPSAAALAASPDGCIYVPFE